MGKQWKQCQTLFFWAPKSLQMVTAAMKLKDASSLACILQLISSVGILGFNNGKVICVTTVRTGHGTTDWVQIGKRVRQVCILSPCLFNFYAEYIMRNAGLEETQPGFKIAGRHINNLRYTDDTTLITESEEELKTS